MNGEFLRIDFRGCSVGVLLLFLTGCSAGTPDEQLAALDAEYEKVLQRYTEAYESAATEEDAEQVFRELYPNRDYFTERYQRLAGKFPNTETEARAFQWIARRGPGKQRAEAVDILFERHSDHPGMNVVASRLRFETRDLRTEERLRQLAKQSPHRKVRAVAIYSLAEFYRTVVSIRSRLDDDEYVKNMSKYCSQEVIEYWRNLDVSTVEVEELLEEVAADYSDITLDGKMNPAELATATLFRMRHLQPQQKAPEIEGPDLDGVPFRLSDYRGKVVLLSFWGHW